MKATPTPSRARLRLVRGTKLAVTLSASVVAALAVTSFAGAAPVRVAPALAAELPTISMGIAAVLEGNSGTVEMVLPVTLSEPSASTVTVQWATTSRPTPTAGVDYEAASGTVTFLPGETEQTVSVTVYGDRIDERGFVWGSDWLPIGMTDPVGAVVGDGFARFGIGLIVDDDPAPTVSIGSVVVAEGDTGTVELVLPMSLSQASESTVTVDWATGSGADPTAGVDYEAASGTVTFLPGETDKSVAVTVYGDTVDEPGQLWDAEWMTVRLTSATNASLPVGPWTRLGFGLILDDD